MNQPRRRVQAIIFDLDGTLIDSFEDIAGAVNQALTHLKRPPQTTEQVARHVGNGVTVLLQKVMAPGVPDKIMLDEAHRHFTDHYRQHCADRTQLYPGARDFLDACGTLPKAVVTNKPEEFSRKILNALNISSLFKAVLGGDSHPERKPRPEPLWEAARQMGADPAQTLMVGDSLVDVKAGKAAGMMTCAVTTGMELPEQLALEKPDHLIKTLSELKRIVL